MTDDTPQPEDTDYTANWNAFQFIPGPQAAEFITALGLDPMKVAAEPLAFIQTRDRVFLKYIALDECTPEQWKTATEILGEDFTSPRS